MNKFLIGAIMAIGTFSNPAHSAQGFCGGFTGQTFGPFDYRKRSEFNLQIVEEHHFNENVANGVAGQSGYLGDDLNYVLTAVPNHTRALATLTALSARTKQITVPGAKFPTECYFERAIRFAPDDGTAFASYSNFLSSQGKPGRALTMMQKAVELDPENPTFNYNLGLLYVKAKQFDKAKVHADKAYQLGFPLPGLRNQLAESHKADPGRK